MDRLRDDDAAADHQDESWNQQLARREPATDGHRVRGWLITNGNPREQATATRMAAEGRGRSRVQPG